MSGGTPRPRCRSLPITDTHRQTHTQAQTRTIIRRQFYYGSAITRQVPYEWYGSRTILVQGDHAARWGGVVGEEGGHTAILLQSSYNPITIFLHYF
jgi:hypothetical protein